MKATKFSLAERKVLAIAFVLLILFTSMDQRESADVKERITSRQYIPVSEPIV